MAATDQSADQLADEAVQRLQQGDAAGAEPLCREALRGNPAHFKALNALAFALCSLGRFEEAERLYLQVAELEPRNAMHWMNVGTARRCAGQLEEALYAFARAASLGAQSADFLYNVALVHIERSDYESARSLLEKAHRLAPEDDEIRFRYAFSCYETLRMDEALAALDGWKPGPSPNVQVNADIGHLLMKLGDPERAEPTVRAAAEAINADPQARLTLIQVLERINRTEEARRMLNDLLADPAASTLRQELTVMQAQLAQREGDHAAAVEFSLRALDGCKELRHRHYQEFPLARSLHALGRYDEAFSAAEAAHRSQAEQLRLSSPMALIRGAPTLAIVEHPSSLEDIKAWNHSGAPSSESSPVFIVAFPRSGTTLLELALDAHPLLKSMDEQPFLQNVIEDILETGTRYPDAMAALSGEQLAAIRAQYWARVGRKISLQPGQRLIDKNPLNMLRLAAIKRVFPNAKVLLAIRHPCDVLLSCFFQHFRAPDFALLCQDLPTLAAGYRRAFDFWYSQQAMLEAQILEVRYESFVADFSERIRQVIEFVGVPWDPACLAPGERAREKRFISTPSYSQVVQPVSSRSVGQWQGYRRQFDPCMPLLLPLLQRWGYEA